MQSYRTAQLCEGCGNWCVRRLVHGVRDIGLIASSVVELEIRLHDCRYIVTSIILPRRLGSGFGDHNGGSIGQMALVTVLDHLIIVNSCA